MQIQALELEVRILREINFGKNQELSINLHYDTFVNLKYIKIEILLLDFLAILKGIFVLGS